jgi:uncharacterized protein YhaN
MAETAAQDMIEWLRKKARVERLARIDYGGMYDQIVDEIERLRAERATLQRENETLSNVRRELESVRAERDRLIDDLAELRSELSHLSDECNAADSKLQRIRLSIERGGYSGARLLAIIDEPETRCVVDDCGYTQQEHFLAHIYSHEFQPQAVRGEQSK